jgi:eukaryotic-like serine/threonine-protein kinase
MRDRAESGGIEIIILRMRSLLQVVWMALVLIIVAVVSALVAMSLAVHGREVKVPDLAGKTVAEARNLSEEVGLGAEVGGEYYNAEVPEGRVLSQVPPAGTTVRRGWTIQLGLSLGGQRIAIPLVVGESDRAAAISITERGLAVGNTARIDLPEAPAGQVIGQDPPANATDALAPKINLLVTQEDPPKVFLMPNFIGQPLGSVTNELKNAGFSVGKVTVAPAVNSLLPTATLSPSAPPSQNPGPAGATPPPAGAVPANTTPAPRLTASPTPASLIAAQDPAPGTKIAEGTPINFVVK